MHDGAAPPPSATDGHDESRTLWPLLVLFWIGSVAAAMAQVYATVRIDGTPPSMPQLVRWIVPGYSAWLIGFPLIAFVLSRRFRFDHGGWALAVPVHALASLILAGTTLAIDALVAGRPDLGFLENMAGFARAWTLWLLFTYWFFLAFVLAIRHYTTASARRLHASRLETALANARLDALRNQLHPHFLFNALNSIASLVGDDPRAARLMIARLADVLRAVLAAGHAEWSLREELELLDRYAGIERVRFGERLNFVVACDDDALDNSVPRLLLQPLVENAILHGIEPALDGGTIRIAARRDTDRLVIEVSDDGVGMGHDARENIGLSNTRERLENCYPGAQSLTVAPRTPSGTLVTVRIPWSTTRHARSTAHNR